MPRVVHFEIQAENPERAARFYTAVFGWTIRKWDGPLEYWLVTTGPADERGIDGGLLIRRGPAPAEGHTSRSAPICCASSTFHLRSSMARARASPGSGIFS